METFNIQELYHILLMAITIFSGFATLLLIPSAIATIHDKLKDKPKTNNNPISLLTGALVAINLTTLLSSINIQVDEKPNSSNSKINSIKSSIIPVTDAYINDVRGNKIKNKNPKSPVYIMKTNSTSGIYSQYGIYQTYNTYQFVIKDKSGVPKTVETTQNPSIIKIQYDVTNDNPYYEQTTCTWTKAVNKIFSDPCYNNTYIIHLKKNSKDTSIGSQLLTNTPSNISTITDPERYQTR